MATEGDVLWRASPELVESLRLTRYRRWLEETYRVRCDDYQALWRWSVDHLETFWESVWRFFEVQSPTPYRAVLESSAMPGARWFPGARINYAREILNRARAEGPAIVHRSETRAAGELTTAQLREAVGRCAAALRAQGVGNGDRVVGYLPSIPETIVALLATSAVGAIWACCSPDFGSRAVLDRFAQLKPKVLIGLDGYRFGGKEFDKRGDLDAIAAALPSLGAVVVIPYLGTAIELPSGRPALRWDTWLEASPAGTLSFADTEFNDPLWIVFTSGTTGLPKGIVHGHGGIVLECLKLLGLQSNIGTNSRFFFYTSSGWINFNILTTALLMGATIVLYDGNPAYPGPDLLWRICDEVEATNFGVSPAYIQLLTKAGVRPRERYRLRSLASVSCTGSTVTPEHFEWLYREVKSDYLVASSSGGTEVATGFFVGSYTEPVWAGEMQVRALGVAVESWNERGESVVEEVGELVVTKPMPSMPLYFWNDPGDRRYRETYFDPWPGIWRHGDLLKITRRGSGVIYGRSDSTLNRLGVRIGTSDIYRIVEAVTGVGDSLVVNIDRADGASEMILFVVTSDGGGVGPALEARIRAELKSEGSPRHVPDRIVAMPAVPYTLTGKKMEVPVKKLLLGLASDKALSRGAMAVATAIDPYLEYATRYRAESAAQ
jgi:acetoacetyl-CoA synthetase